MQIKILGTRGNIRPSKPYHSRHSGVLIDGRLMIDVGEREFLEEKPEWIFLTHLHPDHAWFVDAKTEEIDFPDVPVYGPEQEKSPVDIEIVSSPVNAGPYRISPIPVVHSVHVKSLAYIVERERKKLLYTGDFVEFEEENALEDTRFDLVITEGSFFRKSGMAREKDGQKFGHAGIPELVEMFRHHTDRIVFIHFGSWFYKDVKEARGKLRKLGKEKELEIVAGYDGMELPV